MDIQQIRNFIAVIEYGSIGRAAEHLNISQPGLSKSIRSLEHKLGVELLERGPNGVTLTEAGVTLLPHAKLIDTETQTALSSIFDIRNGVTGTISIGAGSSWMGKMLPRVVTRFHATRPDVRFRIVSGYKGRLIRALLDADLDVVLSSPPEDRCYEELTFIQLAQDDRNVIARRDHPLASASNVTLTELMDFPWVLPTRHMGGRERMVERFVEHGLAPPEPVIETESWQFLMEILRTTDFLSVTNDEMLKHEDSFGLAMLKCPDITFTRRTGVLFRSDRMLPIAAKMFIRELSDVSRSVGHI